MNSPARRYLRGLYLWHRRLGIAALVLFSVLVVTGVMLNHTAQLHLSEKRVINPWVLHWYGISPTLPDPVFQVRSHYLGQLEDRLFLDTRLLGTLSGDLVGAVERDGLLLVVTTQHLIAYLLDGELVESQVLPSALRGKVERVGITRDGRLVVTGHGRTMSIDQDLLAWMKEGEILSVNWVTPSRLPPTVSNALAGLGSPLTIERVVLDLHSGRFFGPYGIYLMDAAALALMVLGLSGAYLWLQHHWRRRSRH